MPKLDEERLEVAKSIQDALAQENLLTPSQARSFVRCLQTSWDVEVIRWNKKDSATQMTQALNLIHAASIFREIEGKSSFSAIQCYKRAAEQLEWLARSHDELNNEVLVSLLAGAAYQLGALPAMSRGLLKQIDSEASGWQIFSLFFQADFDGVLKISNALWQFYPELIGRDSSSRLLGEKSHDTFSWYITVELARTIGLISYTLSRGDNSRLEKGVEKLISLERLATRTLSADISILISLLKEVTIGFKDTSIYNSISRLSEIDPTKKDRLKALARHQYHNGRGVLWPSQLAGIDKLLEQSSFALCTPTGSGKTLVANLALIKELLLLHNDPEFLPMAMYLVPSRALAGEVETKLTREMGSEFIITGLYGGNDWGITDYWLDADRPTVLIATVEKADALMRYLGPLIITRLKLLIVDEAHQIVPDDPEYASRNFSKHSDRSLRLESLVSRILYQSPNISRIALTAVAGGASGPVARWFEENHVARPVGLNYRSTRQVIGFLEARSESAPILKLDLMNGSPLSVEGRNVSPYLNLRIDAMPKLPAPIRNSLNHYNQLEILWTALHLQQGNRRILISIAQSPEKTMKWYCEALKFKTWSRLVVFGAPEDKIYKEALGTAIDYCGEDSYEVMLLKSGIATSHGQMPQRLRLLMTNLIERGICSITIATATLTEGVNLPFDIIFIPQLRRSSFDFAEERPVIKPLSVSEFRNLSGRAGRPGVGLSMEGLTLVSLPQAPSTTAKNTIATQQKQLREAQGDYARLRRALIEKDDTADEIDSPLALLISTLFNKTFELGLVENNDEFLDWLDSISPGEISEDAGTGSESKAAQLADTLDELDSILLSATEEINQLDEARLESQNAEVLLRQLWKKTFSAYATAHEEWIEYAFVKRGAALIETIYPDRDERNRLYKYGFPPYLGQRFDDLYEPIKKVLENAENYGVLSIQDRCDVFSELADFMCNDRGFGFSVRNTTSAEATLENWENILNWWLNNPEADSPEANELREWQRFVSDNLEFRLGVAVGAVVARAWSDGANDVLAIPSLEEWKGTAGLPWFGFWVRELLRWGTHDPFVAFSLAQGIAKTRSEAAHIKSDFVVWLENKKEDIDGDDWIDPQLFLQWKKSISKKERPISEDVIFRARLTGTKGILDQYAVAPIYKDGVLIWIDPAGFELARTDIPDWQVPVDIHKSDFKMTIEKGSGVVRKIF